MQNTLRNTFNFIFEEPLLQEIEFISKLYTFKEGDIIIDFNENISNMPLMLSGAIKILREDFDEGELLLYFLEKGDTCAMSMQCCMDDAKSQIRAIAENEGQLILIPVIKMNEWLAKYSSWRNFVFNSYNNRLKEMLIALDNLAFLNMDERLLNLLNEKSKINNSKHIHNTHQEIAYDLNTSRVVVSRILKALENKGKIKLNRSYIELL